LVKTPVPRLVVLPLVTAMPIKGFAPIGMLMLFFPSWVQLLPFADE
jgi:hypothetical protein